MVLIEDPVSEVEMASIVRHLDLFYGSKQALFDINLSFLKRSVTALIGPSGCGKTTLLRCFNRMNDEVSECKVRGRGDLEVDGINVYDDSVDVFALRAKVGMVFQKPNPFPKSIYDNVAYGPKLHRLTSSKGELDDVVQKSLTRAGLWEEVKSRLHESAMNLSGGQKQRLCIARAIAVKPMLLLMDEPCSALDPIATTAIEELIQELKQRFTIIVVTHSIVQTKKISDMVAFLHNGKLIEHGNTEVFFNNPQSKYAKDYITGKLS